MAVEIISRPIGHKLNTVDISASIIDSSGDALVYTGTAHGLSDGDYVFIESNFDAYNGFKYVDSIAYDSFKIKESEEGDYVPYKQDTDISFRISVLDHGFQSVHLPIVYELESDLYPENTIEESYTNRVISFAADSNGYTGIQASSNFINISSLDYIEFIGDGPLAGVYQVLELIDPDEVIINLAWDASNVFSGYELRKYYNNYFITVDIYGGFETNHRWHDEKPFELLASLKLIPDSNNRIKFSISEILKGQIITRNNLTLDTLPNNIDFVTQFYISYYESYDVSDGTNITSESQEPTDDSDNFIGVALNSVMPFKSLNQGHMSDYISGDSYLARWLTTMDRPIAWYGHYFDLSFINRFNGLDVLIKKNGDDYLTVTNPGVGILRISIDIENTDTELCIVAYIKGGLIDIAIQSLLNNPGPGTNWINIGAAIVDVTRATIGSSDILYVDFDLIEGLSYDIYLTFSRTGSATGNVTLSVLDNAYATEFSSSAPFSDENIVLSFTANANSKKIGIVAAWTNNTTDHIFVAALSVDAPESRITEEICIDVIQECENSLISDDLRLTEGGLFRELE